MKVKLSVRAVEAIVPAEKDVIAWDAELSGFGLKTTPKGKKTYFLYYRTKDGQQRRPAIGAHGPVRPEAAREIAKRWLAEVAQGRDPSLTRSQDRVAPLVRALCARYLTDFAEPRKKASSVEGDRRLIDLHILPALGSKKVASVTRADFSALHHSLKRKPYAANRMLALASKMFSLAERWGMRPEGSNPAKNIDRFPEEKRQRFLNREEVARLWAVLNSQEARNKVSASSIAALKLLILTGRRLNEVLGMKWSWVDFDAKVLRLPDTKSGALLVSLGDAAIKMLAELKAGAGDHVYVIPSRRSGQSLVNLQKPWRQIRSMADLENVRIHDLRHTFASVGAGLGMSLPLLGRLLGHTQAATTARYAHLAQVHVKVAADAIGAELERMANSDLV
ncbi:MAG: tyrosine-type recombinase/integrase [Sphingomonas sp.]|uniref:tyrosine-type recombinase/integrase n=1 Tax=Sphingomonas sp. TaxID=28214 RepID=UPI00184DB26C|nr:site-specific integrase [Sphingomonas sp.]MBA3666812.1 tyrosine-type recombinase/integrase [Sphingomonas sp.]